MELFLIMKIITEISFTCEPVTARVHDPSPVGRRSEPGCGLERGLERGLQADQRRQEVRRQLLSIYRTLWGSGK